MSGKLYAVSGGLGGGSKTKLIHQIFAGVNIAMASEAMGLVATAGLNTRKAFDELRGSEGDSWIFGNRVPHMLDPGLPPYSAITIIAKDVVWLNETHLSWKIQLTLVGTRESSQAQVGILVFHFHSYPLLNSCTWVVYRQGGERRMTVSWCDCTCLAVTT